MLSLELLVMSNGEKVLCWEPQHCVRSEEHILKTQRYYSMEAWSNMALWFFLFVFSVFLFLSSSRKQCTYERDVQKREMYSCGADWCAHLAMVFCATTCLLELGSSALTANWRNEIPTPRLADKWAAQLFAWKVVSKLCSA